MKVSFLIPAYNEAATIARSSSGSPRCRSTSSSSSSTTARPTARRRSSTARRASDLVVLRQANRGKGAALRAAIPHVDGDIVVIQDADLEYDPADVPALIEPIVDGVADVVYGSRLSGGRPQRAYLFWHLVGNRFLSLVTGVLYNTTLSDMETGYKAFRARRLASSTCVRTASGSSRRSPGRICKRGLRIYELPISYYGRTYAEGKKITWRDGLKALWVLVRVRAPLMRPWRVALASWVAALAVVAALAYSGWRDVPAFLAARAEPARGICGLHARADKSVCSGRRSPWPWTSFDFWRVYLRRGDRYWTADAAGAVLELTRTSG